MPRVSVYRAVLHIGVCLLIASSVPVTANAQAYRFVRAWGTTGTGNGQFQAIQGIAVDSLGSVYVSDWWAHRVQRFDSLGTYLAQWGSLGVEDGQFSFPSFVTTDAVGNVFVADTLNDRIQKFSSTGTFLTKWGAYGTANGQLAYPLGLGIGTDGNVYVAERWNNRIQKFSSSGAYLAKWGSLGSGNGQFSEPLGVAASSSGNVYVTDAGNDRVQVFDSIGTYLGQWGASGSGDGQFSWPAGLALDAAGDVYVVDASNNRIQKFGPDGTFITKWGVPGTGDGEFDAPVSVAVDASGDVYVTDGGSNQRVQVFALDPPSLAWVGTTGYETDGVNPDRGNPSSAGSPTSFCFRVKYTDATGNEPLKARCIIQQKLCGQGWKAYQYVGLHRASGDIAAGAVYTASRKLPNETLRYQFLFTAADGSAVTGPPTAFTNGPLLNGAPHLCWTGKTGYTADGVDPDSGPTGTVFKFAVLYADAGGDTPTQAQLLVNRNGALFRQKTLVAAPGGDFATGRTFRISVPIPKTGTYQYRFDFADATGAATGAPALWQDGPTIGTSTALTVAGLAALPTAAGTQVTFALSDAAEVTVSVLNVAGRPVRTLASGRPLEAGLQTLVWDRRADSGLAVPAGLYLIRVTARSADGAQGSALATVSLR
jgi:sugar lactone lactonase YvrE